MKKRNSIIDFEKFLFAIIIVLFHGVLVFDRECGLPFHCGFIGVEFYFIVSGYLITEKAMSYSGDDIWGENVRQLKKRVLGILPFIILAAITSNILDIAGRFSWQGFCQNILLSYVDIFGLQMAGFLGYIASGVSWYLSALFIFSFIMFPLVGIKKRGYTLYIAPVSALLILGYLCMTEKYLNDPGVWLGLVYKGALRGCADLSLGAVAYEITQSINKKESTKKNLCIFRLLEISTILVMFGYAILHKQSDIYDFMLVFVALMSVSVSFSKFSIGQERLFDKKIYSALGIFSLSIYLNHHYIATILPRYIVTDNKPILFAWYLGIVSVLSLLNYIIGRTFQKSKKSRPFIIVAVFAVFVALVMMVSFANKTVTRLEMKINGFDGKGTIEEPYLIQDAQDLRNLALLVNRGLDTEDICFLQNKDIDLQGQEWEPIGRFNCGSYFKGIYDGSNHLINNLVINDDISSDADNNGLFGLLEGTVMNLGIESGSISGDCVGAIASQGFENAMIVNCYNKAKVNGTIRAAGICDNITDGSIICCANVGEIDGKIATSCIVSYNAASVIATFPAEYSVNENFTGNYTEVELVGDELADKLDYGITYMLKNNIDIPDGVTYWNK